MFKVYAELNDEVTKRINRRPGLNQLNSQVSEMLDQIRQYGAPKLEELRAKFDGLAGELRKVSISEVDNQAEKCSPELVLAIEVAISNIEKFHSFQRPQVSKIEIQPGLNCWRKSQAIPAVGLYVPGGTAPLFSTLIMLAVPAKIVACPRIVVCTPPNGDGTLHPAIALVAKRLSLTEIYLIGGTQAIGLMAYGTDKISAVDKIFGPGNQYVTTAKQIVSGQGIAIDMPAGPSEVLIVADESANPAFVAADLLAQCEHGSDSQAVLLSDSADFIDKVKSEVAQQIESLQRAELLKSSLKNSFALKVRNLEEAIKISNVYAPEHLIIASSYSALLAERVINAGSVFLGNFSAEVFGDYASGTNHTLPTAGYARAFSGVSCDSFSKVITFQELSSAAAKDLASTVDILARTEGLDAHAIAATLRAKD